MHASLLASHCEHILAQYLVDLDVVQSLVYVMQQRQEERLLLQ